MRVGAVWRVGRGDKGGEVSGAGAGGFRQKGGRGHRSRLRGWGYEAGELGKAEGASGRRQGEEDWLFGKVIEELKEGGWAG